MYFLDPRLNTVCEIHHTRNDFHVDEFDQRHYKVQLFIAFLEIGSLTEFVLIVAFVYVVYTTVEEKPEKSI